MHFVPPVVRRRIEVADVDVIEERILRLQRLQDRIDEVVEDRLEADLRDAPVGDVGLIESIVEPRAVTVGTCPIRKKTDAGCSLKSG